MTTKNGKTELVALVQSNSAGTILNICAILSKMGLHREAYDYANQAILKLDEAKTFLKTQMEEVFNDSTELTNLRSLHLNGMWENMKSTYVIAHYNAAVELEFQHLWLDAAKMYQRALDTTQR